MTDRRTADKRYKIRRGYAMTRAELGTDGRLHNLLVKPSTGATSAPVRVVPGDVRRLIDEAIAARAAKERGS